MSSSRKYSDKIIFHPLTTHYYINQSHNSHIYKLLQAQIRLAETLRKMGEQGALDPEAAAELDKIKGKLAKYKGKMGKGFDDLAVDELEWMDNNKNVKAITIIFYETSL